MAYNSTEEQAEEKKKPGYNFLDDIEKSDEDVKEKTQSETTKKQKSDEFDLFSARKKNGGTYDFLEGIEDVEPEKLSRPAQKKTETAKPTESEALPDIKMKGLLGKVYSGEIQPSVSDKPTRSLGGLLGLERASQIGKKLKGDIVETGDGYRVIRQKGEKSLTYLVTLPDFTQDEKKLFREIEKRAISEVNVDTDAIIDYAEKKRIFTEKVNELLETEYPDIKTDKQSWFAKLIVQDMIGYGILDPLLSDDALEEVMVIGTGIPVYVYHRKHGMCKTNIIFEDHEESLKVIARIARAVGRRVDTSTPLLDARLKDGSRVNATVQPISLAGPSLTIRKFKADPLTVVDIIKFGTMTSELAAFLWLAIDGYEVKPANMLVSGGTGSGKTTTLNCLGSFIPQTNRIISIEDTAELQLPIKHWIRLETRPPNIEGKGEINMDMLLRNTLRMRPDRIIVGEVRGGEARTLLTAMNTGQSGSLGTLHANNSKETVTRLVNKPMSVPVIMLSALNLILMQNRFSHRGKTVRRITEVSEIWGVEDGNVQLKNIFEWDPRTDKVVSTEVPSRIKKVLAEKRGVEIKDIDDEILRRTKVLEWMVDKGIKGVKEVGRLVNEYYIDPDRFMDRNVSGSEKGEEQKKPKNTQTKGIGDLFAQDKKEVLEKSGSSEIIRVEGEKNPVYQVQIPKFSKEDKDLIKQIETKVIEQLDIDPASMEDKKEAEKVFTEKVGRYIKKRHSLGPGKTKEFTAFVVNNLIGYGILENLLNDEGLEEIMVIGTGKNVYANHNKYGICKTNLIFDEDEDVERILERIAASVGRRIDRATPLLDARLLDGSRVNATIPPISIDGPTLTIRKFKEDPLTIVNLINFNTLNPDVAAYLWYAVEGAGIKPSNILVAGGSGSGKTTTLNCLCSFIPDTERIITIEDTAELRIPATHWIRLETKPPNVEGVGEITMDDLVKNTLRMRPDRVIVGEVRGPEARTLFTAMNTGHDGSMGTLHSNSAKETITRLTNPPMDVPHIMMPALDLILMENKIYLEGKTVRRITEIAEVSEENEKGDETISLNVVYRWNPKTDEVESAAQHSVLKQNLGRIQGVDVKVVEEEIDKRKRVLTYMMDKKITKIDDVGRVISRYYSENEDLMTEVEGK